MEKIFIEKYEIKSTKIIYPIISHGIYSKYLQQIIEKY